MLNSLYENDKVPTEKMEKRKRNIHAKEEDLELLRNPCRPLWILV